MSRIIEEVIELGIRRITRQGPGRAIIYLPKEFSYLIGRKAIVVIKVLREDKEV